MQSSSAALKDKVPALKLSKAQDSTRFSEVKSQIFSNICLSERNTMAKKSVPPKSSEFQVKLKSNLQDKKLLSIYSHMEDLERDLSETTLNILNTTASNNFYIEENFPKVLNDIERSVTLLKKFYLDLSQKRQFKGAHTNPSQLSMNTVSHIEDTRSLPSVDIDVIQSEYEKVYHRKTKDLQTLYDFYTHEYLNGSFKSTNASNHTPKTNSNSSLSSNIYYNIAGGDNHTAMPHEVIGKTDMLYNKLETIYSLPQKKLAQEHEHKRHESVTEHSSKPAIPIIRPLKLSGVTGVSNPKVLTHKERLEQIKSISNRGKSLGSLADLISSNSKLSGYNKENREPVVLTERARDLKAKATGFDLKEVYELTQKTAMKKPVMSINLQNINTVTKEKTSKKASGKKPLSARNYTDKENEPKQEKSAKKDAEKLMKGKEEVFSKIFEKNMLINKLKQDINDNLQKLNKGKKSGNNEFASLLESKLSPKQGSNPDWFENKRLKAMDLNEGVIENGSENTSDRNSENSIKLRDQNIVDDSLKFDNENAAKQEVNQPQITEHAITLLTQQLPLSNSDLKVINELKTISNMLNQNEVVAMIQSNENADTNLHALQKKVKLSEEFKTNKFFVPEIPKRKVQIRDTNKLNQEEDLKHKKELDNFYTNRQIISELEDILDKSNSALDMNFEGEDSFEDGLEFFDDIKFEQGNGEVDLNNLSLDLKD